MSDSDHFKQVYLKEIGVHTPISSFETEGHQHSPIDEMPAEGMTLASLEREVSQCHRCVLSEQRQQTVFGVGKSDADLLLIGEAPGQSEDQQGEPFVGRAGQLLNRMLQSIGMDRQSVYIMNTVKCRPPNNRDPRVEEVEACSYWFDQQLRLISPKMICVLGRVAAQTILNSDAPLGQLRGRWHEFRGIPVWVTYHPAFLLRSPQQKVKSWQDLQLIRNKIEELS